jgi:hypothetical protein
MLEDAGFAAVDAGALFRVVHAMSLPSSSRFLHAMAAIALFGLVACTTAAQREVARMDRETTVALGETAQCSARAEASEPFRRLRAKLPPVDGTLPSAALLADRSRPTEAEAALLVELHVGYIAPCRRLVIQRLGTINPAFAEVAARNFADADAEYAKLVQRQETWGGYAQSFVHRRAAVTQAFSEAGERINRDLVWSHATELLQRHRGGMGE